MNSDGSSQTNLTTNGGLDRYPAWSFDGTRIAFSSFRDANEEIYVMGRDGSDPINITNNPAYDSNPSWSPDGSKIVFASDRGGDEEIFVMNADGSNVVQLTNESTSQNFLPTWSPDGTRIAFVSNRDGRVEIYVMDTDGSNQTLLTNNPPFGSMDPAWSPNSAKIAFFIPTNGDRGEIYVINADGSNQTPLSGGIDEDNGPTWSPDGTQIAFSRNVGAPGFSDIYVMDEDGSNQTNLTNSPGADLLPDWRLTPPPPFRITTTSLPNGVKDAPYSHQVVASGGTGLGLTWTIDSGALRQDYHSRPLALPATVISGTPTTAGTFNFAVKATDSDGSFATQALSIQIVESLVITTTSISAGFRNAPFNQQVIASGGSGSGFTWTVSAGALFAGIITFDHGHSQRPYFRYADSFRHVWIHG